MTDSWGTGFDSSLFSALNSNTQWHTYYNIPLQGGSLGIVTAMITIGYIAGAFLAGPATDRWGRRGGMLSGSAVIVVSGILMAAGTNRSSFMAGRFFTGVGASICSAAGASWVAESAPPQWRGPATYLFNSLYLPGAILSSGIAAGTGHMHSNWSWRIPVIVQIVPSAIVVLFVWFLPESPRWMILNDRFDEAKNFISTYHADGNEDAPLVMLQMLEMRQAISQDASDKRWYDYSEFIATRANIWRLFQVISMAFIGTCFEGRVQHASSLTIPRPMGW
jgi:MFS family permease